MRRSGRAAWWAVLWISALPSLAAADETVEPWDDGITPHRRFTVDGLAQLATGLTPVAWGWRTGPTATMLVFTLEYAKLWFPWRWWRAAVHIGLGWALFPLRYLDLLAMRSPKAGQIGNHCYIWLRKPAGQ